MNEMKRFFLKILPYFLCFVSFGIFYAIGKQFEGDIKNLMHGISGSFLAIPILYLIYDLSKEFSNKKLNRELFDYAKMQIDQDVLSIINQLMKLSLPYEEVTLSPPRIEQFLSNSEDNFKNKLEKSEYLGFQVFKSWEITEKNISKILENPFVLEHLENEQTIAIINLLKAIQSFDVMPKNINDLYFCTDKNSDGYRLEKGTDINNKNKDFPDRYLLLRELSNNEYLVSDFGDFPKYQTEKLLFKYKINPKYSSLLATSIYGLVKCIDIWLDASGNEFILNEKMFRPVSPNSV
jgi:hypothetical protein